MKLSVVIPVYNEEKTIGKVLSRVRALEDIVYEVVIIDDGSSDGTPEVLKRYMEEEWCRVFFHGKNEGKGAALRTGFEKVTGDVVVVQDADCEYDPEEYRKLIEPIALGKADVVYGSRFMGGGPHRVVFFWHMLGNKLLTFLSNMFTNLNLTDMETGYKMIKTEYAKKIKIRENRFGVEPELTAKLAKMRCRFYEVGISYSGRTYEEGKKIGIKDGFRALYAILKYNLLDK